MTATNHRDNADRDLEQLPVLSPYQQWQAGEGIPVHEGTVVDDLATVEVGPWERVGAHGAFINLAGQEKDDGQLIEVPPGGRTAVLRHMYESMVYVAAGRGSTTLWQPDGVKQTVAWQRGTLFSPPLNCFYQHTNADPGRPARLFAVTSAPTVINLFHNDDFVFANDYVFDDRFAGADGFFSGEGRLLAKRVLKTNMVPDVARFPLQEWRERGAGSKNLVFAMSGNTMASHVSEFPVGTYKKGHRHGPGAHIVIIGGEGYSLLWYQGEAKKRRVDWRPGMVLSPGDNEFHQHFNFGANPVRYLALRWNSPEFPPRGFNQTWFHTGPEQISYEDQDVDIHELFVAECALRGVEVHMDIQS